MSTAKGNLLDMPIDKAIRMMAIPSAIGFFFNTMYNVIDTMYAGLVSVEALAAVGISFPVFMILIAIGNGFAGAGNALISNAIGAGNIEKAVRYTVQGLIFCIVGTVVVCGLTIYFLDFFLHLMKITESEVATGASYTITLLLAGIFFSFNFTLNSGLSARGETKTFRNALIVGFFLNIGLDPLFLYGWSVGDFVIIPRMEVVGIAVATDVIQVGTTIYLTVIAIKKGVFVGFNTSYLKPDKAIMLDWFRNFLPITLNMLMISIGMLIINYLASFYTGDAVAAYGIGLRVEQIALVPTIGLNIAIVTLCGQNAGAKRYDQIPRVVFTGLKYGVIVWVVAYLPINIFSDHIFTLFSDSETVRSMATSYIRMQMFTFLAYILLGACTAVLQGLKRPGVVIFIGIYRYLGLPLIAPFLMHSAIFGDEEFGLNGLWLSIAIMNISASLLLALITSYNYKSVLRLHKETLGTATS